MRFDLHKLQLKHLWFQKNFAYVLAGLLCVSNIILITALVCHEEQWVLIPQFDVADKIPVSRSSLSDAYLEKWGAGVLQDLLTSNPDSVDLKVHRFLEIAETSFGSLEARLRKQAQKQKEEGFSTAFYPKETQVLPKVIKISGVLLTYFGGDKKPILVSKTFCLGYQRVRHGVVLITSLENLHAS